MEKYVIYRNHTDGAFYMTSAKNYHACVQNARAIHRIEDATTIDDIREFIRKCCRWYGDIPEDYIIIE